MRTPVIALASIFLVVAVTLLVFPPWRFETLAISERRAGGSSVSEHALIKFNRLTGSAERMEDGKWAAIGQEKEEAKHPEVRLPAEAAKFVTGRAGFESPTNFTVRVYNGSNYRLSAVIVGVKAEAKNPEHSYDRGYYQVTDIEPLSEGSVSVSATQPTDYVRHDWSLSTLYGVEVLKK